MIQKLIIYYKETLINALDFQDKTGIREIEDQEGESYISKCLSETEPGYIITIKGKNIEIIQLEDSKILYLKLFSIPLHIFLFVDKKDDPSIDFSMLEQVSTMFLGMYDKNSLKLWNGQVNFFSPFQNIIKNLFALTDRNKLMEKETTSNQNTEIINTRNTEIINTRNTEIINTSKFNLLWNISFLVIGIIILSVNFLIIENPTLFFIFIYLGGSCLIGPFLTISGNFLKIKDMKTYEYTIISFILCLNCIVMGYLTFTTLNYFFSPV